MKIDRVRAIHVRAEWDTHEPLGEMGLARPTFIYPELEAAQAALAHRGYERRPALPGGRPFLAHRQRRGRDRHLWSHRR